MALSTPILWLLIGLLLTGSEAFLAPGIGLFFAGLGAILTSIVIYLLGDISGFAQLGLFCAFTAISAVLLWKPLKKWQRPKNQGGYQNMVGSTAIVMSEQLNKTVDGQVKWSGAMLNARLDTSSVHQTLQKNTTVEIVRMDGNLVYVREQ